MLKNKVIVVTGGAGLIGSAFCRAITDQGGFAVIADMDDQKGKALETPLGTNALFHPLDITSRSSLETLIKTVHEKKGHIDALVNNAYPRNKNYGRHFFDVTYEDFSENISLNLGGYFLASQTFARYFVDQGFGNIVNISSIYGLVAPRFQVYEGTQMTTPVEYAAIKSGLNHLTRYMAKLFKDKNIRVNTLSPGGILDKQPESFLNNYRNFCLNKGMLDPEDICGTLVYLLSDTSRYVNGQNILVDDGFSL